jgi:hypothetical protein
VALGSSRAPGIAVVVVSGSSKAPEQIEAVLTVSATGASPMEVPHAALSVAVEAAEAARAPVAPAGPPAWAGAPAAAAAVVAAGGGDSNAGGQIHEIE